MDDSKPFVASALATKIRPLPGQTILVLKDSRYAYDGIRLTQNSAVSKKKNGSIRESGGRTLNFNSEIGSR